MQDLPIPGNEVDVNSKAALERGDALLEMALVVPVMLLIVAFILLVGPYIRVSIAADQASYDCAMAAAQSLNASQGYTQGYVTALKSFDSFDLGSSAVEVAISGSWERGGQVICTVSYTMPLGAFPMLQVLAIPESVSDMTILPVQLFKSEWMED